jgi:hypothetical protein
MKKLWLSLAPFLFAATAVAQLSNFPSTAITTSSADLTCVGVATPACPTWPMPPIPTPGSSYVDPNYGTTTWRMQAPSANTGGNNSPCYSRVQGFNANNHYMIAPENTVEQTDLFDATTTPPTPINRITTSDGSWINCVSGDAQWSFTVPNRLYYIGAFQLTGSLQLRYVDVTSCTTSNCVLTPVTVHDFAADNVGGTGHACTSDSYFPGGAGISGNQIDIGSGGQGNFGDATDIHFIFSCEYVGESGRGAIDLIAYNASTDTVTTQKKWYTICPGSVPSGCVEWATYHWNIYRMNQHPDGVHAEILWQTGGADSAWAIGTGTEFYTQTFTLLGPVAGYDGHNDTGYDVNGIPVYVGVGGGQAPGDAAYSSVTVANLNTLSPTGVVAKYFTLPCTFAYLGSNPCGFTSPFLGAKVNGTHVSMTGTWGSTPGYALYSTMILAGQQGQGNVDSPTATTLGTAVTSAGVHTVTPASMATIGVGTQQLVDFGSANIETVSVTAATSTTFTANFVNTHLTTAPVSNLSAGDTGFAAMELLALKIDSTATNGSAIQFWRLGRAMSIRDTDYGAEPHAFVSRNWEAYMWGSNWNTDVVGDVYAYYTQLSGGGTSYTLTVSTTGTGSGSISGTNCSSGSYASGTTIGACTATPGSGSTFAGWSGTLGCTGTGTCTETITANSTMIATFNTTAGAPGTAPQLLLGIP